jgi:hypothetical protein
MAIVALLVISAMSFADQGPTGPESIENKSTETAPVREAFMINTSGGTFTTLILNVTAQTYRWKAYAGNVSGKLSLDDSDNYTIFDWTITATTGEVYATRTDTLIDWASIECANATHVETEEYELNLSSSWDDSINKTFIVTPNIHEEFYVGANYIENNTCPSVATYVNDTAQNQTFQEVLLYDGSYMVYSGLLEDGAKGFDNNYYDFQLIVPESGLEGGQAPTPYYFYVEIV